MDINGFMSVDVSYIHATQLLSSSESMRCVCQRNTECVVVVIEVVEVVASFPPPVVVMMVDVVALCLCVSC